MLIFQYFQINRMFIILKKVLKINEYPLKLMRYLRNLLKFIPTNNRSPKVILSFPPLSFSLSVFSLPPSPSSTFQKGLWSMFAHNVISFRRGLMNGSTADMFRRFLHEEVIKVSHSTHKKVIGTKVVNVTKLLNDLSFWAEVER